MGPRLRSANVEECNAAYCTALLPHFAPTEVFVRPANQQNSHHQVQAFFRAWLRMHRPLTSTFGRRLLC